MCLAPAHDHYWTSVLYALDHAYFMLISVHGLKINHGFEINHLCEFGPEGLLLPIIHVVPRFQRLLSQKQEQVEKPAPIKARLRRGDDDECSQGVKHRPRRTDDVHSAISDEGILTTDDIEDDSYERNRTRTMESEE